ncbi:hypothetical protein JGS22_010300 [Streptomyces sp. P38-E01]|uniref:DUF8175 domain-containing protein n=1 Tax=Streptomyces tardus TaxID=2780544 RepID=A0A949JGA3_9ACTN|nr:hypothetical protein [Streptomyces tardus]MBU7597989.1 hypothetical protein [Streptomyces tardus]
MSFGGGDESGHATTGRQGTRTRLPENEGGPRPAPMRPGKSMLVVVGVVMLLIAAIAFATRGEESDGGRGDDAKGEDARPTAPTGEKPVPGKGDGIPSGFAQSEQGAQSAATNYAVALGGDGMFKKPSRDAIVSTIYTTGSGDKLRPGLDKAYSEKFLQNVGLDEAGEAPEGSTFVSRTTPIGAKVTDYTSDSATVEVWCVGLIGLTGEDSTTPVKESWFTVTQNLNWSNGDWKITASKQTEGPSPVPGDNRASSADEIAEAVEGFGGFTYAR